MRALILAAGRGERMRPLTDHIPKPLLTVRGKRLIEWHIEALARGGVRDIVINTAWLEAQFPTLLGDGARYGVRLHYSHEQRDHGGALETAGGIAKALPELCADGDDCFWVVSGDVFVPDFEFDAAKADDFSRGSDLAHLWLVANPPHHPNGDFGITAGRATSDARSDQPRYTWSSVGLFRAAMFERIVPGTRRALRPCLEAAIEQGALGAEIYAGPWTDVGTAERLQAINT